MFFFSYFEDYICHVALWVAFDNFSLRTVVKRYRNVTFRNTNHISRCSTPTSAWLWVYPSRRALRSTPCRDQWSAAAGDQSCPGAPGAAASGSLQAHPASRPLRTVLHSEKLSSYLWDVKAGLCSSLLQRSPAGRHKKTAKCLSDDKVVP